jgi:hypothetical protein
MMSRSSILPSPGFSSGRRCCKNKPVLNRQSAGWKMIKKIILDYQSAQF